MKITVESDTDGEAKFKTVWTKAHTLVVTGLRRVGVDGEVEISHVFFGAEPRRVYGLLCAVTEEVRGMIPPLKMVKTKDDGT